MALELANDTSHGLGATVRTQDAERGEALPGGSSPACVGERAVVRSPAPVGGVKRSGYGRELAAVGMHAFTNIRTLKVMAT